MTGLTAKKRRLTKRQLKNLREPNAMTKRCLKLGDSQRVGGTQYFGKPPVYIPREPYPGGPVEWIKAQPGIPFIRG